MSEVNLTQEKWNMILDMRDTVKKQGDELDRLRRMYRALLEKNETLESKFLQLTTSHSFNTIFK